MESTIPDVDDDVRRRRRVARKVPGRRVVVVRCVVVARVLGLQRGALSTGSCSALPPDTHPEVLVADAVHIAPRRDVL